MNTFYFDLIIYTLQVILFQFLSSPKLSKLAYNQALATNKEWVSQNPTILAKFPPPLAWPHRLMGMTLLAVLAYGAVVARPDLFRVVHMISATVFVIQHLGIDVLRRKKMLREIPPSPTRKANLYPRKLSAYIPMPLIQILSVALVVSVAGWIYLFVFGNLSETVRAEILTRLVVTYTAGLVTLYYVIKRKPIKADANTSLFFRKTEVLMVFIILSGFVLHHSILLAAHAFEINLLLDSPRWANYTFSLLPMLMFTWFLLSPTMQKLASESFVENKA